MKTVRDAREAFAMRWSQVDRANPPEMVEVIGSSFLADEPAIISEPNTEYIARELAWYQSMELDVNKIPPPVPKIWQEVAGLGGQINSNYGYLVFGAENGHQYGNVVMELLRNRASRRAVAIYTRPSMHSDATKNGMNDFVCTNAVNYFVRDDRLHAVVQMRSNDAVFGYPNDYAWQLFVQRQIAAAVGCEVGDMVWQAASLHVYPRHYRLLDELLEKLA